MNLHNQTQTTVYERARPFTRMTRTLSLVPPQPLEVLIHDLFRRLDNRAVLIGAVCLRILRDRYQDGPAPQSPVEIDSDRNNRGDALDGSDDVDFAEFELKLIDREDQDEAIHLSRESKRGHSDFGRWRRKRNDGRKPRHYKSWRCDRMDNERVI